MAQPRKLPRTLSIAEVDAVFRAAHENPRDLFLLQMLFYTGVRNGELRNQTIENIDFINGMVLVKQGKGKKDRNVPIPPAFTERIRAFVVDRRGGPLFFGGDRDGLLSPVHIRRIVKKYARNADIRNWQEVHPHTFRHSYATFLRNRGVALDELKTLLGHERADTTMIYSKLALETIKASVERAFSGHISAPEVG